MDALTSVMSTRDSRSSRSSKHHRSSSEPVSVVRLSPFVYLHVLDTSTNVTRVVSGPTTFTRQDHERIVSGPTKMLAVPPRHYLVIGDPVCRDADGAPILDAHGTAKLRFGDSEIRLADDFADPFPLYPGESVAGELEPLQLIPQNTAFRLQATRDFEAGDGIKRRAGDEWFAHGPATYIPSVAVDIVEELSATIIKPDMALKIRARKACKDLNGVDRLAGEEWIVRKRGAYMPGVDEVVVQTVHAVVLTEKKALHMRATKSFTDVYKIQRKAGEEWLVTLDMASVHIPDVHEEMIGDVHITTVTRRQFCIVLDPVVKGKNQLGSKKLVRGESSFFLQPGESLEDGIEDVIVLADDEALLLKAHESFTDKTPQSMLSWNSGRAGAGGAGAMLQAAAAGGGDGADWSVLRRPGDLWMVFGPAEYVPTTAEEIVERRRALPLDENEGIYVRDTATGHVRAVIGQTYMLTPTEVLWEKDLPDEVERLLQQQSHGQAYIVQQYNNGSNSSNSKQRPKALAPLGSSGSSCGKKTRRDRTRVVTFRVPHNSATQIYDFKTKKQRVVFGPDLVMLGPEEQFTVVRLSGDKPKRPNVIRSLTLMLGPDFMTDIITVETSDHARLSLTLSYNWRFDTTGEDVAATANAIFSVRDFTGDACKAIASRVRGAVAAETFDNFHKFSAKIIRGSVFGISPETGKVGDAFRFDNNRLVITNVDVQAVEPVDARTRESLQKSVTLAIEITTQAQEARAKHAAKREEEEAKGLLLQQQLNNKASAEKTRRRLLELEAESAAIESQGVATAKAQAKARAKQIEAEAEVALARAKAEATVIQSKARLEQMKLEHQAEIEHERAMTEIKVTKAEKMAAIEAQKFKQLVDAIGAGTIAEMARAGPEMQAKLLQGLGLKGYLVTDGKNPINLFSTAQGMVGGGIGGGGAAAAGGGGGAVVAAE